MTEKQRQQMRDRYADHKAKHMCVGCGTQVTDTVWCATCCTRLSKYVKQRVANGQCYECSDKAVRGKRCLKHAVRALERSKESYRRRKALRPVEIKQCSYAECTGVVAPPSKNYCSLHADPQYRMALKKENHICVRCSAPAAVKEGRQMTLCQRHLEYCADHTAKRLKSTEAAADIVGEISEPTVSQLSAT